MNEMNKKRRTGKQAEWNKEVCGMSECAAERPPAYNPLIEKQKQPHSAINATQINFINSFFSELMS